MPEPSRVHHIEEPYVKASIMTPPDYIGPLMDLCQRKRGQFVNMEYLDDNRVELVYDIPLSEIIFNFYW